MALKTFKRGIHPHYYKELTSGKTIQQIEPGKEVVIPLQQHIGKICGSLVKKGDSVKVGQKIGDTEAFVSSPVHAPVSGTVKGIEPRLIYTGSRVMSIVLENDFEYTLSEDAVPKGDYRDLSKEQLIEIIHQAGIVGMGGAGFPVHIKLSPPKGKQAEFVILNGAECEPYLSSDHRTMLEHTQELLYGLEVLLYITGAKKGIIAVEDNKPDVIEKLNSMQLPDTMECFPMETKYPQGSEKHLIYTVTGREVPHGQLPIDVGVIVNNVDTCIAIYRAIKKGIPLIHRRVTVSGLAVKEPGVFDVPVGVSFREIVEAAGGLKEEPTKILMGGPMMGIAQTSLDVPVVKTTSGLLLLTEKETKQMEEGPCLRCGKCVDVCPMGLMPYQIANAGRREDLEQAIRLRAMDCIECGSCAYTCPAHRRLMERIRLAKTKIQTYQNRNERDKSQK